MVARRKRKKNKKRAARPGERVAGTVVLALLVCIGLAVYLTGRSDEAALVMGEPGAAGELQVLVPGEIENLQLSRTQTYQPDNLYEYINGQAPHYIDFGFRQLLVAEYASSPTEMPSLIVDLYDMSRRRNAYGLFTGSVPPEEEATALGNGGYASENLAVFWKGPYYVRVTSPTGSDRSERVREAAESIAEMIQDDSSELAEFSAFPEEGLIPETIAFSKSSAFGLPYLEEAFIATYEGGSEEQGSYRLFFTQRSSPEEAVKLLQQHTEFLESGEGLIEAEYGGEESLVWGEDRYVGATFFLARDDLVAGCLKITDRDRAERISRRLLERADEAIKAEEM